MIQDLILTFLYAYIQLGIIMKECCEYKEVQFKNNNKQFFTCNIRRKHSLSCSTTGLYLLVQFRVSLEKRKIK